MTTTANDRASVLESARNHIYEAFELLAGRDDVPEALVESILTAYRAVRKHEPPEED